MTLIGLMHVRNEDWVLGLSLPAAMELVDRMIVLDHDSTDATPQIIAATAAAYPGRVRVIPWTGRHYNEAEIRQRLLDEGRAFGGTHFFMIDADEVVTGPHVDTIADACRGLEPGACLQLPWLAMWGSRHAYRDDESVWANNFKIFAFADVRPEPDGTQPAPAGAGRSPAASPVPQATPRTTQQPVSFRAYRDGFDMHQAPRGVNLPAVRPWERMDLGGVMHLQFADRRRLLAKQAWYKMSETARFPGRATPDELNAKYNPAVDEQGMQLARAPAEWWARYEHLTRHYHTGRRPWHEVEIERFWNELGPDVFDGLELWGVPERVTAESTDRTNQTREHGVPIAG